MTENHKSTAADGKIDGRDIREGGFSWVERELYYVFAPLIGRDAAFLYQVMTDLIPQAERSPMLQLSNRNIGRVSLMAPATQQRNMEVLLRIGMIELVARGARGVPVYKLVTLRELAKVGIVELQRRLGAESVATVPPWNSGEEVDQADTPAEIDADASGSPVVRDLPAEELETTPYGARPATEGGEALTVPPGNSEGEKEAVDGFGGNLTLVEMRLFQKKGVTVPEKGGNCSTSDSAFNTNLSNQVHPPPTPLPGGTSLSIQASAALCDEEQEQKQELPGDAKDQAKSRDPLQAELALITLAVAKVMRECGLSETRRMPRTLADAMRLEAAKTDEPASWNAIAERMIAGYQGYLDNKHLLAYAVNASRFFAEGWWADNRKWPWDDEKLERHRRRL